MIINIDLLSGIICENNTLGLFISVDTVLCNSRQIGECNLNSTALPNFEIVIKYHPSLGD